MQKTVSFVSRDTLLRVQKHMIALDSPDQSLALKAENRLIRFGSKAVEPLFSALSHPNPAVRFRAVWVLGFSKDPRAFNAICSLLEDEDERVRYDATIALGHYGDERAVPLLWKLVQNRDDLSLGSAARIALLKFGIETPSEE